MVAETIEKNPLQAYLRVPKLYVILPSRGNWGNPATASKISGEIPIYPLTSMDELLLRNPDALLNGESLIRVIQSCTGMETRNEIYGLTINDVNLILVAIRFATYGKAMEIEGSCPKCNEDVDVIVNLETVLESAEELDAEYVLNLDNGLSIYLKPHSYEVTQQVALAAFREASAMNVLTDTTIDESERLNQFNKSFIVLADLTLTTLCDSVDRVVVPATEKSESTVVKEREHILEWVKSLNKEVADQMMDKVAMINQIGISNTWPAECSACNHTWEQSLEFNAANFFGAGS